ncbi:MAG: hypothetical protein HY048_05280 [Acidobacteria bacterium]|nr:hypothetical protein [Acidobacteriota bacterium]
MLPASLADDVERLARFRREAQVLAALNHPPIAQIYGFEDSGATSALGMELVDGPALADRITQGRNWEAPVSSGGGAEPVWAHDGRELFYRSHSRLMSVTVPDGSSLAVGPSRMLFDAPYNPGISSGDRDPSYAVSPDNQRFLMLRAVTSSSTGNEVIVTLNWLEELKRLAPIAKH